MLIAERLLRLLLGEDAAAVRSRVRVPDAIGAALVAELTLLGLVGYDAARLTLPVPVGRDDAPEDAALAATLAMLRPTPLPVSLAVRRLGREVAPLVEERVAASPGSADDPVRAVLVDGEAPDDATAALVTVLAAFEQADRVVEHPGTSGRAIAARAQQVADSSWGAAGVAETVRAAAAVAAGSPWTGAIDRVVADRH